MKGWIGNPSIRGMVQGSYMAELDLKQPFALFNSTSTTILAKHLYHKVKLPTTALTAEKEIYFFKDVQGSKDTEGRTIDLTTTNNKGTSGEALGHAFIFDTVGVFLHVGTPTPYETESDFSATIERFKKGVLVLKKNTTTYLEIPLHQCFALASPIPGNEGGQLSQVMHDFGFPIVIKPGSQWEINIVFPDEEFLPEVEQGITPLLEVVLHGIEVRNTSAV